MSLKGLMRPVTLSQEPKTIVTCVAEGGDGLVDVHAYSVGGMYAVGDVQLVKLQNPWGRGTSAQDAWLKG